MENASAVALDYASSATRRRRPFTVGRPLTWLSVALLVGLWALPAWFGLFMTDVDSFYMRPMCDGIAAIFLGGIVGLIFVVRWFAITRRQDRPARRAEVQALFRALLVAATSLALPWFDANASGVQLAFRWHRAAFEAARAEAMSTLAPFQSAPHGPIGPFQIVRVKRGMNGVAFELATGSGIEFGNETLLVPPGDYGPLGGGWSWNATE